ncbi:rod shape-determining protein [Patescibacteria group bacterium]|nr:rod shape-determining protein [Patescibacteria group bacterium]
MKTSWLNSLTDYIAIDLGTSRVRIWGKQAGFVVDDDTAVAVDTTTQKVVAVGREAVEMSGRVGTHIQVIRPVTPQGIQESEVVIAMLQAMMQKVFRLGLFFRPVMMISIHSHLGDPERQLLVDTLLRVGAREVYVVDEVLAAAIGTGVPVADASGSLFLHLGAGVTEAGMISLGSVVTSRSSRFAGNAVSKSVQQFLREEYGVSVGLSRAEALKQQLLGSGGRVSRQVRVAGQSLSTKAPVEVLVDVSKLVTLLDPVISESAELTRKLLEKVPPELAQDVLDKGMLVSGGSAQLVSLPSRLSEQLGFPVSVVDDPAKVVILGMSQILSNLDLFIESIGYRQK